MSAPTPLDLDEIRKRYAAELPSAWENASAHRRILYELGKDSRRIVPQLLEEVERLRADVALLRPALAQLEEGFEEESDAHDALKAEVARLTARPAPAWDEEAVVEAIERVLGWQHLRRHSGMSDEWMAATLGAILAVVRDHQPVKPGREDVGAAIRHALKTRTSAHFGLSEYDLADVALDLWPGRSEAEVKAEALQAVRTEIERAMTALDAYTHEHAETARAALRGCLRVVDRTAAEGGAS